MSVIGSFTEGRMQRNRKSGPKRWRGGHEYCLAVLLLGTALPTRASHVAQEHTVAALPSTVVAKVSAGQFTAAESELRVILQSKMASPAANFLLGYVLFRERRFVDSLAAYTAGAKLTTPSPDDLVIVASDYIQLRSYPDAERWLTYVTEHDPQNATAWYMLGRTQYLLDRSDQALQAFTRCLKLRPHDLPAKYNEGLALERLQRPDDAEATYREAIRWATEAQSRDPQPWLNLGNLLLSQQKFRSAAESLADAVRRAPENPLCQQQLGVALEALGDHAGAIAALQRAITLAPKAERAHFYLARSLKQSGKKQESEAEFAAVATLHSSREGIETPNPDSVISPPLGGVLRN